MRFTDIFIKKPVLSIVVSLIILFLGIRSFTSLGIRQFPKTAATLITVQTAYPGAGADVIKGFITTPLERAIASSEGIDYMTSTNTEGLSTIDVYMVLNYDPNAALAEVLSEVNSVLNQLPKQAQLPVITKTSITATPSLFLASISKTITSSQITDYLTRMVIPQIQAINGVGQVFIFGNKTFAMRIWLNPIKMAEYNITPLQIDNALISNNYIAATGYTKGPYIQINTSAATDLHSVRQFKNLVVANDNGTLLRIKDIATVELGSINYNSQAIYKGESGVALGIYATPGANPLTVVNNIRKILPGIDKQLPVGMNLKVAHDRTEYIKASISEILKTIVITLIVVIIVIFLFLGSYRSVAIPIIAIPLSIIGGLFIMFILRYTINILTLLAMVLAIGLVVDDAIIIVENVDRHILEGKTPFNAALLAARELGVPIIAMSLTLIAVFLPIGFMSGLTGALFKEFAFTLAGDVIISGIVALTLSPMLSSKFLNENIGKKGFSHLLEISFDKIRIIYSKLLKSVLNYRAIVVLVIIVVLSSAYFLLKTSKSELAPTEDQGIVIINGTSEPTATLNTLNIYAKHIENIFTSFRQQEKYFMALGPGNTIFGGMLLKPWNQRKETEMQIIPQIQKKLNTITGLKVVAFPLPSLPGASGLPIEFVVTTTAGYNELYNTTEKFMAQARKSGLFAYMDSDLKYDQPQINISINKSKALSMGINMQELGDTLSTLLSENYINWFTMQGYSYQVTPQIEQKFRYYPHQLGEYYIQASNGQLVPLSSVIKTKISVVPESLNQFNQLNSATISATMRSGVTLGQAITYLENLFPKVFPSGFTYNFAGQSRQYIQQGHTIIITFVFALIIIFLVLAALFESFIDPLIILFSVPMSLTGALIFLNLGFATINIYTEMGLLMLIGLVSKHGILMTRFANDLQENEGLNKREAIEKAAAIRLRPILMTTAAMVFGVFPLIFAKGAGAVSRFDIGLVIATGLGIGTFLTIFIVPTVYSFIGQVKKSLKNPPHP
ncbi:MAG: efflux RND transporter permease subunit [Candidatus Omnitrophica bacterium]|nr:efflux RND transporter permease subunit [Candidatus Omnitrophota bacterium]